MSPDYVINRQRTVGLVMAVTITAFLVLVFSGTLSRLLSATPNRVVTAEVANSQQLKAGDAVRIDGVAVGRVDQLTPLDGRIGTRVKMRIEDGAGPLFADASAQIRTRTVLGGTFVVTLRRGTRASGPLDGAIPMSHTSNQVELEDVLGVTRGAARRGLQRLPLEMSKALSDPDILPAALTGVVRIAPGATDAATALRGSVPGYDLRDLVRTSAKVSAALDAPAPQLRRLISHSATTMGVLARRRDDVQRILASLPAGLRTTRSTLADLDGTLSLLDPALKRVDVVAPRVGPSLAALRGTTQQADVVLRRARPLLDRLRPAAASIARFSLNGLPLLQELIPSLDRLDQTLLPMLGEKDPVTEKPLGTMIGGWGAALGSGAAAGKDANGRFVRFPATAGSSNAYLPCQTYVNSPDHPSAVECDALNDALGTLLSGTPPAKSKGGSR